MRRRKIVDISVVYLFVQGKRKKVLTNEKTEKKMFLTCRQANNAKRSFIKIKSLEKKAPRGFGIYVFYLEKHRRAPSSFAQIAEVCRYLALIWLLFFFIKTQCKDKKIFRTVIASA